MKQNTMNMNLDNTLPVLGKPELVRGKAYIIHEKAAVGKEYFIICPVCNSQTHIKPEEKGVHIEVCAKCKAQLGYNASLSVKSENKEETEERVTEINRVLSHKGNAGNGGRLVWGILGLHSENLSVGKNIIGRNDKDTPSDISIDDAYMSRRSISIDVEKNLSSYTFKLTVLKAANPVVVNSHELHVGNSIYLNYGDTIKLGNTVLTFKKAKK